MRKPKELPILYSTDMVNAVIEGRKTQTRRVVTANNTVGFVIKKKLLDFSTIYLNGILGVKVKELATDALWRGECKWQPGDLLYVRETFAWGAYRKTISYKADGKLPFESTWKPSIHMPKEASRIWLRVKNVWPERLKDITPQEIISEGIKRDDNPATALLIDRWIKLWDSINKSRGFGWQENPVVWVVDFEVISKNGRPDNV